MLWIVSGVERGVRNSTMLVRRVIADAFELATAVLPKEIEELMGQSCAESYGYAQVADLDRGTRT